MAGKGDVFENDFLKLIFNNVGITGLADPAAGGITVLYVALHTSDPGEAGNQSTSEVSYTGYERVAVARSAAGWNVVNNQANPVQPIEFGEMLAGNSGTATHMSVGTAQSGAGKILYSGALSPSIPFSVGVTPRLRTTTTITED